MPVGWTQADIDTLKQALLDRKGARTIQFDNQSVTFESIDDMLKLLAVMEQSITPSRTRFAATRKGV
jgi:hypothetical protein